MNRVDKLRALSMERRLITFAKGIIESLPHWKSSAKLVMIDLCDCSYSGVGGLNARSHQFIGGRSHPEDFGVNSETGWESEMAKIKMKCRGFSSGPCWVPPFELRDDEAITFVMPHGSFEHSQGLVDTLVDNRAGTVELFGRASWAAPAATPSGLRRWIHGYSATSWLRRVSGIATAQASEIVRRLQIDRDDLRSLAGNPRLYLGLEAAWARAAEILIFSTVAIDPSGVEKAFEMVREHLSLCPAIYLSFPFITQNTITHNVFPGSTVYETARTAPLTV
jgi:hypothetical protein